MQRSYNRQVHELRPIRLVYNIFEYADGSTLFEIGKTRVVCAITLAAGVPHFLKGKQQGWLSASYSLLPASTKSRIERDSISKRNERSVEISRLIGRVLRTVVKLPLIGERTIYVDCDVLQADGGTRTACITAAGAALRMAQEKWLKNGLISEPLLVDDVAAVSIGTVDDIYLVDLDFSEDSRADADFNFVFTKSGKILEVQGTAERNAIPWQAVETMGTLAFNATQKLFEYCLAQPYKNNLSPVITNSLDSIDQDPAVL